MLDMQCFRSSPLIKRMVANCGPRQHQRVSAELQGPLRRLSQPLKRQAQLPSPPPPAPHSRLPQPLSPPPPPPRSHPLTLHSHPPQPPSLPALPPRSRPSQPPSPAPQAPSRRETAAPAQRPARSRPCAQPSARPCSRARARRHRRRRLPHRRHRRRRHRRRPRRQVWPRILCQFLVLTQSGSLLGIGSTVNIPSSPARMVSSGLTELISLHWQDTMLSQMVLLCRRQRRPIPRDPGERLLQRAGLARQQVGQQEWQLAGRPGPGEPAAC